MCPVRFLTRSSLICNAFLWFVTEHRDNHSKDRRKLRARKQGGPSSLADDVVMLKSGFQTKVLSAYGNKSDSVREQKPHRRTKRFLSYPRFVEVTVVADRKMMSYHGANLQHYVLTLMSIVSTHKRTWFMSPYRCHWELVWPPCRALENHSELAFYRLRQVTGRNIRLFISCCFVIVMAINIECLFCDHLNVLIYLKGIISKPLGNSAR